MERSPRGAGVPHTGLSMAQCHTLRSFVISLVIAIAISKSSASGFTLAQNLTKPDLETGESKQLEVRYDLKTDLNNNGTIYNNTREDSNPTVIAITNINNKQNYRDEKNTEKPPIVNETDKPRNISENNKIEVPSDSTTTVSYAFNTTAHSTNQTTQTVSFAFNTTEPSAKETTKTAAFNTTLPNNIQTTSTESERSQSTTSSAQTSLPTKSVIENSTVTNTIKKNETIAAKDKNDTVDITTIVAQDTNTATNNDFSTDIQPLVTTYDSVLNESTINDSISKFSTERIFSDQKAYQTNPKEESAKTKTESSLDSPTTISSEAKTGETGATDVTSENFTVEDFNIDLESSKLPPWKKYTTIDRKRTSTEDTTITEKDMARAETAQTRISLEKVFTNTPIPSIEKLTSDLIDAQESTTRPLETSHGIESSFASIAETNTYTTKTDTEVETEPTKLEIVSRRAGYKDNRETTTPKPEEATTTKLSLTVSMNNKEMYSTMYETGEFEMSRNKNSSVYESQSQLAEDAIKEELLKEETLNNEENAKFLKQERIIDANPEIVSVDVLRVKPIGQEKKKNTILYAVSPNYKVPKKIDVQPLKQFVRDPDDNSWRNESISSLGIVFKPKNASKSFTQVLKNKTETELGNMTDNDSKDDLPDLRVRLEKIAEVRKSKKRINKFGDTVYSDYEESGENTNPSLEDKTTPMTPFTPTVETTFKFSSSPPTQSSTTEFDLRNAIPKDHFDLFKTERTPLTTNPYKPKKFYNLAEYYDSTDEYDADYVNQHKIDLKKFTKPTKTTEDIATQPPELLRTEPMKEYQPERKATLQYFPPTQKVAQKVNMNDYDNNFNRKVNLYELNKSPPKDALAVSFGTVSPIPTEKYTYNKVTMKATYTPAYQPDNLDKNLYLTNQPLVSEPHPSDGTFNRASYVIKHYRDFISEAAKDGEDERSEDYTYTETPVHGVTINDMAKVIPRDSNQGEEDYEYEVKYRKDIMNRFVDNFNQNSERFKVDFPILYNSSVVHRPPEHGQVASSSAFMKRLYEVGDTRPTNFLRRPCDPQCDKTVELSPAYELHYYVPDEEEKEQIQPRPATPPYRFRL